MGSGVVQQISNTVISYKLENNKSCLRLKKTLSFVTFIVCQTFIIIIEHKMMFEVRVLNKVKQRKQLIAKFY